MTAPTPEEHNAAEDLTEEPPGEHGSEAPGAGDGAQDTAAEQEENAESSVDQPSS